MSAPPYLRSAPFRVLAVLLAAALAVAAFVVAAPSSTPARAADPILPVSTWESRFQSTWASDHSRNLPYSSNGNSWDYYNLAYSMDANTAMFQATGKTQYLDRALLYVKNMVDDARVSSSLSGSQFKDGYMGWTSQRSDTRGQEVPLFESYNWRYVTRLLWAIRQNPSVYQDSGYRAQYDRYLAFTERNMFDKWFSRGPNSYIYRQNAHMASHWAYICDYLGRMTADATRQARCKTVVDNINLHLPNFNNNSLRRQIITNPVNSTANFWTLNWGSFSRPGSDMNHANGVVSFVVEDHDLGNEWTAADMTRFSNLLTKVLWPSEGTNRHYLDGTGSGNGWFNDGFVKLGRYDSAVQKRLEGHSPNGTQFFANMALNAKILNDGSTPPTPTPTPTTPTPTPTTPTPTPTTPPPTTTTPPAAVSLSAAATPGTVTHGSSATVTGSLSRTGGAAVAGEPVDVYRRAKGASAWTNLGRLTTNASGAVSYANAPTVNSEYQLRHPATTGFTAATSGTVSVNVAPKITTSATNTNAAAGARSIITGTVAPNHRGQQVHLEQLRSGSWNRVGTATLDSASRFRFTPGLGSARGTFTYRVQKPADADHVAATSANVVLVRR